MAWDKDKPAAGTTIQNSNPEILANQAAIEATLPSVASGTGHPLGADGTAGRRFRGIYLLIVDGTNASTLKCTVGSRWNGDTIAETDNIAKGGTTGNFSLSADGKTLTIEASGFSGNVLYALGNFYYNDTGTDLIGQATPAANDILIYTRNSVAGALLDITILADAGSMYFDIFYITDA